MNQNIYLLGLGSLLLQTTFSAGKSVQKNPNIVFILADDLGYGDISCLNKNGKIHTLNIDRIAKSGMTFTDAHSSSAVCTPSRYGILTGRYNWRSHLKNGVLGVYDKPLMTTERTNMANMLKQKGYQTACIGKWHLGWNWPTTNNQKPVDTAIAFNIDYSKPITGGPVDVGFDYFFGHDAPNYPPYCFIENRNTVGIPSEYYSEFKFKDNRPGRGIPSWDQEQILPMLQNKAIDYISKASKNDAPFFLYFPLTAPHTPIAPSKEFQGTSGLNDYADLVLEVDNLVGEILNTLEKTGLAENTIVVFTSDNGCSPQADFPFLTGKGHYSSYIYRGMKSDLFEGGHRIPCLVQWPGKIRYPHTISQTVCLNDFMATFASIIGYNLKDNEAEDSYNLLPAMLKPGYTKKIREATVHHSINGNFTIRKDKWKLLLVAGSGGWSSPKPGIEEVGLPDVQLYNLKQDPSETLNVKDKYPEVVKELNAILKNYIEKGRSTPGTQQKNDGVYPWNQVSKIINFN
jgi:arylsulfatase A-like enzyme